MHSYLVACFQQVAEAEKRTSRPFLNFIIMKNFKTICIAFLLAGSFFLSSTMQAQSQGVITTQDLSEISAINGTKMGFPWNGCHEFEVEIGVGPIQVTTTVIICCVQGVCNPVFGQNGGNKSVGAGATKISNSTSIDYGGYMISIADGTYSVTSKSEIRNVVYKLVPKK